MVFSIIFKKPFVVIGNATRGMARFESLLSLLGLKDRLVDSVSKAMGIMDDPIDYDSVHAIILAKRKEALDFLSQIQ